MAMALVNALSSTFAAYSSAQTTLRMCHCPELSCSMRLTQKSAVSRSSGHASSRSHSVSRETQKYCQAASATHPVMWCSLVPVVAHDGVSSMPLSALSQGIIAPW